MSDEGDHAEHTARAMSEALQDLDPALVEDVMKPALTTQEDIRTLHACVQHHVQSKPLQN
jgi:hypothetical protein